jgi:hypothetical protein
MDLLTASATLLGFGLGIKIYIFYKKSQKEKIRKAIDSSPIPVYMPTDLQTTCTAKGEPHRWERLAMMNINSKEPMDTLVCMDCGVISGTNNQFSQAGLANIKRQQEITKQRNEFLEELKAFEEAELTAMANWASDNEKDNALFRAGYAAYSEIAAKLEAKVVEKKAQMYKELVEKIGSKGTDK